MECKIKKCDMWLPAYRSLVCMWRAA